MGQRKMNGIGKNVKGDLENTVRMRKENEEEDDEEEEEEVEEEEDQL